MIHFIKDITLVDNAAIGTVTEVRAVFLQSGQPTVTISSLTPASGITFSSGIISIDYNYVSGVPDGVTPLTVEVEVDYDVGQICDTYVEIFSDPLTELTLNLTLDDGSLYPASNLLVRDVTDNVVLGDQTDSPFYVDPTHTYQVEFDLTNFKFERFDSILEGVTPLSIVDDTLDNDVQVVGHTTPFTMASSRTLDATFRHAKYSLYDASDLYSSMVKVVGGTTTIQELTDMRWDLAAPNPWGNDFTQLTAVNQPELVNAGSYSYARFNGNEEVLLPTTTLNGESAQVIWSGKTDTRTPLPGTSTGDYTNQYTTFDLGVTLHTWHNRNSGNKNYYTFGTASIVSPNIGANGNGLNNSQFQLTTNVRSILRFGDSHDTAVATAVEVKQFEDGVGEIFDAGIYGGNLGLSLRSDSRIGNASSNVIVTGNRTGGYWYGDFYRMWVFAEPFRYDERTYAEDGIKTDFNIVY